ncbi:MAG: tetratricopeptide repeat protein [Pirellulales bacterium]
MLQSKYLLSAVPVLAALLLCSGCSTFGRPPAFSSASEAPAAGDSAVRQVSFEESEAASAEIDPVDLETKPWWDPFLLGSLNDVAREATGQVTQNPAKAKKLFAEAEAVYERGLKQTGSSKDATLKDAASRFERAVAYHEESTLQENSLMMAGDCFYFLDDYPAAMDYYNQLVSKYPNTRHLDTIGYRRFKLGQYWLTKYQENPSWSMMPNLTDDQYPLFDRYGHAIKQFDLIRLDDPTGKLADDATLAAATAHFKEGRYQDADRFYEDLRDNFPTSEHQFTAHFLGLYCKLRIYQGPEYDGTPLEEAEKLGKRIERQFPDQARENREVLDKAKAEVRAEKAGRRWHLASYYDKRADYGGAKFYYSMIVKEFPGSNMADEAAKRLAEISDRPNKAPQKAKWLVDIISPIDDDLPKISRQIDRGGQTQLR